ncbi:MAG: hypothetical protein RSE41_09160, partial [Clostridia bacterium]
MIKINENGKIFDEGYKLNMSNDIFNDMFVSIENVNIIKFDLLDDFYIVYEKNSYITLNPYISMLIEDDVYVNCKYFYIAHISEINNILQLPSYKLYDYDITSKEIIDYVKTVNYVVDGYIYNELKQTGHIINELEKTNSSCKDLIIETIDSTDCG